MRPRPATRPFFARRGCGRADERRRTLILDYVRQSTQAILTATDPGMFTDSFLQEAQTLHVTGGQIEAGVTVPD